ncbi:MAG: DEAD/DEAH box helicase [Sphingobium sp.]|nr:DEAD/DEAH box helicase [Sphingobium sp.]
MTYFSDLGLAEPVLRALGAKGYADPTPIQRQSIPALLEGRDLLGIAQTGTGKTAAFSLPSIHRLAANPQPRKPAACRMLVLSPTRELAAQIAENIRGYAKYLALNVQCVFGGVPVGKQARALVPGCDILVATPGRLLDLIDQRALTLRNVEIFVLDEADQMMDLGFIHALKRVAGMLPKERQSLFFSATMPQAMADLGKQFVNDPVRVEVTPQATTAERVEQYATFLNQAEKQALLTIKLRQGLADGSIDRALVFTRTKHGADRVVKHLVTAGIEAAAIHGNKSQGQRTAAIHGFRSGSIRVLVATDIAARGIDIPGVSHVFNYELPNVAEQYVHRIGRTARAGADGIAMSFVAPDEKPYLRDIEKLTRVKLDIMPLPEDFTREAARLPLPSRKQVQTAVGEGENRHKPHRRNGASEGQRRERPVRDDQGRQRREHPVRDTQGEQRRERPVHGRDRREGFGDTRGYDPLGQLERDVRANRDQTRGEARDGGRDGGRPQRKVQDPRPFGAREDNRQAPRRDGFRPDHGQRNDRQRDGGQRAEHGQQAERGYRGENRRPEGERGPRTDQGRRPEGGQRTDNGRRFEGGHRAEGGRQDQGQRQGAGRGGQFRSGQHGGQSQGGRRSPAGRSR